MRNLIVSSLVSLDGIHGDPQSRAGDYFDQQAAEESLAVLPGSDAMLMGRNTYDYFAPRWSSPSGPYLERICEMRKYVFSSTLTAADWNNTTIIPGDPVAAARELKQQGDRHLVIYGYGQLARTLLEHGLAGKLNFVINPVMAGSGMPCRLLSGRGLIRIWDHLFIDKLLEITVILIFSAKYIPSLQEGRESRDLPHPLLPDAPSRVVDSALPV